MAIRDSNDPNLIRLIAPAGGVTGGTLVLIGSVLILPMGDARAGNTFTALAAGPVTDAPAATGEAWTSPDSLFWDDTAKKLTKTSAGNTQCGYATKDKAGADTTGSFCLTAPEGTQGTGSTADITDGAVTLAKMANLAQDKFITRTTASTGVPQVATCTAAGRALIDDADAAAQRQTLGLGTAATAASTAFDAAGAAAAVSAALGTAATLASDTDAALTANSDVKLATQKAVKAYVDAALAAALAADSGGGGFTSQNARYTKADVQSFSGNTVIDYGTKDFDETSPLVTNPAGVWKFTAAIAGKYSVKAQLLLDNAVYSAGDTLYLKIRKNAAVVSYTQQVIEAISTQYLVLSIADTVALGAGDYIQILTDAGATHTSTPLVNFVAIERVG